MRHRWTIAALLLSSLELTGLARAQGMGGSSGSMLESGGTALLPSGGAGFIPYRGGPGGGLGVMPRRSEPAMPRASIGGMGLLGGSSRTGIVPLTPIRSSGFGPNRGMGLRGMGARPSRMPAMPRPPVGSYPFRQPASLIGPGSGGPSMAM